MVIPFNPVVLIYAVVVGTPALFTISYLIAAWYGHVPWCFPPLDGCATITRIGTHAPESYVFRFGAYPLMAVQAGLFYLFKRWLQQVSGRAFRLRECAWLLGLAGCLSMIGSMAVMQGPDEIAEPVHTILALGYYVLMLVSQSLLTLEDYRQRQTQSRIAPAIRLGTLFLQAGLVASLPLLWFAAGVPPNAQYQWLVVATILLWYSSLLFEGEPAFVGRVTESERERVGVPGTSIRQSELRTASSVFQEKGPLTESSANEGRPPLVNPTDAGAR